MKISKMTAGMGRTIPGEKQYENYKPFTSIEVEVDESDDIQDVKKFISDHLKMWQAEVESDVHGKINGTTQGQWGEVNQPTDYGAAPLQYPTPIQVGPYGPYPAQQIPHPPTAPVNGPFPPPSPPQKPSVGEMFQGEISLSSGNMVEDLKSSDYEIEETVFEGVDDWEADGD